MRHLGQRVWTPRGCAPVAAQSGSVSSVGETSAISSKTSRKIFSDPSQKRSTAAPRSSTTHRCEACRAVKQTLVRRRQFGARARALSLSLSLRRDQTRTRWSRTTSRQPAVPTSTAVRTTPYEGTGNLISKRSRPLSSPERERCGDFNAGVTSPGEEGWSLLDNLNSTLVSLQSPRRYI